MSLTKLKQKVLYVQSLAKELSKQMRQINNLLDQQNNSSLFNQSKLINSGQIKDDIIRKRQKVDENQTNDLGISFIEQSQEMEQNIQQDVQISCNQVFDQPKDALPHLIEYHKKKKDIFQKIKCNYCEAYYNGQRKMIQHQIMKHKQELKKERE